jgi:agmatine deiminase
MPRLPAEYEAQSATWLTWPANPETWPGIRDAAENDYATFAATISRFQPLNLICAAPLQANALRRLRAAGVDESRLSLHDWPANDAWCRDHGPLFVHSENGGRAIVDFPYNAWGGKFSPWDDDDAIARRVSDLRKLPRLRVPIFGEGGAVEVNARGVMINTESVWLNPNRNPGLTRAAAEQIFADYLGVTETIWLPEGLVGDDTDGHIDTISRFVDDDTVVTVLPETNDINYPVLRRNVEILQARFNVVSLPLPAPIHMKDWREEVLPATYANFLILNDAVLVPSYAQPTRDDQALGILRDLFPARDVLPIPCENLILEGGALHCLSMQESM